MHISNIAKSFYFVRHGVTDANQNKLWCGGDWDIELNEEGRQQAIASSERILSLDPQIDIIFSSPMKRASETTSLINSIAKRPVVTVEDLREWKVGQLERTPWVNPLLGKSISDWEDPPGGETVSIFQKRIQNATLQCLKNAECPLISSHGAVGRVLLGLFEIEDRHIKNCKLHRIFPVKTKSGIHWEITD